MAPAKVFKSGNRQAVRRRGDEVVLREKSKGLERAFWLLADLPIDIDAIKRARKEPPQKRKGL